MVYSTVWTTDHKSVFNDSLKKMCLEHLGEAF